MDSMFSKGFKAHKCKTLLKLAIARVKLLRNKRDIQVKQMRREIAKLLQNGQEPSARIRVEHIVREQNVMAAYDILELFCELIVVRLPVIESQRQCPLDLKEAIASVIFAAPRCADLPELLEVRGLFAAKYGKEFVSAAAELRPSCGVNRKIIEKLSVRAPSGETKLKLLKEIAAENNVEWDPADSESELLKPAEDLLDGPSQFLASSVAQSVSVKKETPNREEQISTKTNEDPSRCDSDPPSFHVPSTATKLPPPVKPSSVAPMYNEDEQFVPFVSKLPGEHPHVGSRTSPPKSTQIFPSPVEKFSESVPQDLENPPVQVKKGSPYPGATTSVEATKEDPYPRTKSTVKMDHNLLPSQTPDQQQKGPSLMHRHGNIPSMSDHEGEVDYVDIASAAQAAAESAELAAAAARAAANLAKGEPSTLARDEKAPKPTGDGGSAGEDNDDMVDPYSFSTEEPDDYANHIRTSMRKDSMPKPAKPVFDDDDDYYGPDVLEAKGLAESMAGRQEILGAWRSSSGSELFTNTSPRQTDKFKFSPQTDSPAQYDDDDDGSFIESGEEQVLKRSDSDKPKLNLNFFTGKQALLDNTYETPGYGEYESPVGKPMSVPLSHNKMLNTKLPSNLEDVDDEDKNVVGESSSHPLSSIPLHLDSDRSTKITNSQAHYSAYDSPPSSSVASRFDECATDGTSMPHVSGARQDSMPSIAMHPPSRAPPDVPKSIQHEPVSRSEGEPLSRSSSGMLSAHKVHPKLPNYDELAAQFSALKSNRR